MMSDLYKTDILRLLASRVHSGSGKLNNNMKQFVQSKQRHGNYIFKLDQTYKRIQLAARIIASISSLQDVVVVCAKQHGQRAVYKFGQYTGCTALASSRWVPGTLTNQNTKKYQEPRLLIVADPKWDRQAVLEASYVNIPTIAICNSDATLEFIDLVIPCNNRIPAALATIFWMLARDAQVLRGKIKAEQWNVLVDLFVTRDLDIIKYFQQRQKREEEQAKRVEGFQRDPNRIIIRAAQDQDW